MQGTLAMRTQQHRHFSPCGRAVVPRFDHGRRGNRPYRLVIIAAPAAQARSLPAVIGWCIARAGSSSDQPRSSSAAVGSFRADVAAPPSVPKWDTARIAARPAEMPARRVMLRNRQFNPRNDRSRLRHAEEDPRCARSGPRTPRASLRRVPFRDSNPRSDDRTERSHHRRSRGDTIMSQGNRGNPRAARGGGNAPGSGTSWHRVPARRLIKAAEHRRPTWVGLRCAQPLHPSLRDTVRPQPQRGCSVQPKGRAERRGSMLSPEMGCG